MEGLEFKPDVMHTIRGTRHAFEVIQTYKNIPGFAPEYKSRVVCDVVVKFTNDEAYIQFPHDGSCNLTIAEMNEITAKASRGYVKSDFKED